AVAACAAAVAAAPAPLAALAAPTALAALAASNTHIEVRTAHGAVSNIADRPLKVDLQVLADPHRRRASRAEHASAGMLKGSHEVEPLDARDGVATELGYRPVRARLIRRGRDTVQVA